MIIKNKFKIELSKLFIKLRYKIWSTIVIKYHKIFDIYDLTRDYEDEWMIINSRDISSIVINFRIYAMGKSNIILFFYFFSVMFFI